jgi:hypothetical protein
VPLSNPRSAFMLPGGGAVFRACRSRARRCSASASVLRRTRFLRNQKTSRCCRFGALSLPRSACLLLDLADVSRLRTPRVRTGSAGVAPPLSAKLAWSQANHLRMRAPALVRARARACLVREDGSSVGTVGEALCVRACVAAGQTFLLSAEDELSTQKRNTVTKPGCTSATPHRTFWKALLPIRTNRPNAAHGLPPPEGCCVLARSGLDPWQAPAVLSRIRPPAQRASRRTAAALLMLGRECYEWPFIIRGSQVHAVV